jgi:hypothetical protein
MLFFDLYNIQTLDSCVFMYSILICCITPVCINTFYTLDSVPLSPILHELSDFVE